MLRGQDELTWSFFQTRSIPGCNAIVDSPWGSQKSILASSCSCQDSNAALSFWLMVVSKALRRISSVVRSSQSSLAVFKGREYYDRTREKGKVATTALIWRLKKKDKSWTVAKTSVVSPSFLGFTEYSWPTFNGLLRGKSLRDFVNYHGTIQFCFHGSFPKGIPEERTQLLLFWTIHGEGRNLLNGWGWGTVGGHIWCSFNPADILNTVFMYWHHPQSWQPIKASLIIQLKSKLSFLYYSLSFDFYPFSVENTVLYNT